MVLLTTMLVASSANAQVFWDRGAGTNLWATGTNWSNDVVPTSSTPLAFNDSPGSNQTVDIGNTDRSAQSLSFSSSYSYNFARSGTKSALNLYGAGTALTQAGSADVTFNLPVWVSVGLNMTGDGAGVVTFNGVISDGGGADILQKNGQFTLVLNGANAQDGTVLNAGTIEFGNNSAAGASGLTINGGIIRAGGGARSLANSMTIGGNFEINGSNDLTLSGAMNLNGGTRTITTTNTALTTFAGAVSNGGLTKAGAGTLVLSGAGTYTGATTVNAGTLRLGGAERIHNSSALTVNAGATFDLNGFAESVDSVAGAGSITLGAGALSTAGATSSAFSGTISGSGSLTKSGTGTLTLSGLNTYAGGTRLAGGTLAVAGNGALGTGVLTMSGGSITAAGGPRTLSNSVAIDASSTIGGTNDLTFTGTLTNTLAGNPTLTIANTGTTTLNAINLSNSSTNRTFTIDNSGTLIVAGAVANGGTSAASSLVKAGSGTLTLSGANTYGGSTRIAGGTLAVASLANGGLASSIGNSSAAATNLVLNGGTLRVTGANVSSNRLFSIGTLGGTIEASGTGLILNGTGSIGFDTQAAGNRTLTLAGTGDGQLAPVLADNGLSSLVKAGTGTWTLTGNNTYSGSTTIAGGTLKVGSGGTTGAIGSGPINNAGALVMNRSDAVSLTGTISGTGSVAQAGSGAVTISGANTYSGGTSITNGTLKIANVAAMGVASSAVNLGGGTLHLATDSDIADYNLTVTANSGLRIDRATTSGTGVYGLGQLSIGAQTLTVSGGSNLAPNAAYDVAFGATTLGGNATFAVGNNGTGTGSLTLGAVGESGGARGVTKTGTGTLVYTGANTYTGTTTVTSGAMIVNAGAQLAGATSGLEMNGGTLDLKNTNQTLATVSGTGGTISLGIANQKLTINETGAKTYAGAFIGDTSTTVMLNDTGTLTLAGANTTFHGTLNVARGTLVAGANDALGATDAKMVVASGGTLALQNGLAYTTAAAVQIAGTGAAGRAGAIDSLGGITTFAGNITVEADATIATSGGSPGSLTLSGNIAQLSTAAANATLAFSPATNAPIIVTGAIQNAGGRILGVTLLGNGTLTLANSGNTYQGDTTVGTASGATTGTLKLGADNALPTTNPTAGLSVYSGTLDLNGYSATGFGNLTLGGGAGSTARVVTNGGTLTLNHDILYRAANNAGGATIEGSLVLGGGGSHFITVENSSAANDDLTIKASIAGAAAISKRGTGTLVLSGANSFTGSAVLEAGITRIENGTALGTGAGATNVYDGAVLQISNASVAGETINLAGSGVSQTGALRNIAGANTWAGNVVLAAGSRIQSDAGTQLTISGGSVTSTANAVLDVGGAGTTAISSAFTNQVKGITKYDSGTLELSGNNAFVGPVDIQAGLVSVRSNSALGADNTTTVRSGATIDFAGGVNATGTLVLNGSGISGTAGALRNVSGTNAFVGNVALGSASTITTAAGSTFSVIAGTVSGSQNLTKTGTGTLGFSGVTGTIGALALNQGAISVSNSTTINTTGLTTAASTSLLIASGGRVSVTGSATFDGTIAGASTGTFDLQGGDLAFHASISAPNLTLNLQNARVYLGGVNITIGTIHITGNTILDFGSSAGTFLSSTNLIVDPGATVRVDNWITVANDTAHSTMWYLRNLSAPPQPTLNTTTTLGATDLSGVAPLTQITFNQPTGSYGTTVTWVSGAHNGWADHEIRPTPEPAAYGAILLAGCLGLVGWRRWRRQDR